MNLAAIIESHPAASVALSHDGSQLTYGELRGGRPGCEPAWRALASSRATTWRSSSRRRLPSSWPTSACWPPAPLPCPSTPRARLPSSPLSSGRFGPLRCSSAVPGQRRRRAPSPTSATRCSSSARTGSSAAPAAAARARGPQRRAGGGDGRSCLRGRGRPAVHLGHGRLAEGGHPHPRELPRQHRPDVARGGPGGLGRRRGAARHPAVPHLRAERRARHEPVLRRPHGPAGTVRSRLAAGGRRRAGHGAAVPQLFAALESFPQATGKELASVRIAISGAARSPPRWPRVRPVGVPIWQAYGLTEASPT